MTDSFLRGFDGWDLLGVIAVVIAFAFLWSLLEERSHSRRRRWRANHDIDRVIEMRRHLTGWQPPEQRHARPRKDAA